MYSEGKGIRAGSCSLYHWWLRMPRFCRSWSSSWSTAIGGAAMMPCHYGHEGLRKPCDGPSIYSWVGNELHVLHQKAMVVTWPSGRLSNAGLHVSFSWTFFASILNLLLFWLLWGSNHQVVLRHPSLLQVDLGKWQSVVSGFVTGRRLSV